MRLASVILAAAAACSTAKTTPTPADAREDAAGATAPADGSVTDVGDPAGATAPADGSVTDAAAGASARLRVLVFSGTKGFRHESIGAGLRGLERLGAARGWSLVATERPNAFAPATLDATDVVVFLLTSGDVLDAAGETALQAFVARGGGVAGLHSATDTEYGWPFWKELFGTYFRAHPPGTPRAVLTATDEPLAASLPRTFTHADEWYTFRDDPARDGTTRVLLTVDEDSYGAPADMRMGHHPIAWTRVVNGGRVFHTALGHTDAAYEDPTFLEHVARGIAWAGGARDPSTVAEDFDGTGQNGVWQPHGPVQSFPFAVGATALRMTDAAGANQHLTRAGLLLDATKPYSIDTLFTIAPDAVGAPRTPGLSSFCVNFDVQGEGGSATDLGRLYARAINLDVGDAGSKGVMKHMGFVDGRFAQIGDRTTSCCRAGVEYRLRIDVNVDGLAPRLGFVTVTLSEGAQVHERFTVDYGTHPYAPDRSKPVRVGVNTHGADWTMRHFRVRTLP